VFCQMRLREAALRGELVRPAFRMPGSPYTNWLTLGFLALVVLLMAVADDAQRIAFLLIPLLVAAIAVGWRVVSRRRARNPLARWPARGGMPVGGAGRAEPPHPAGPIRPARGCGGDPRAARRCGNAPGPPRPAAAFVRRRRAPPGGAPFQRPVPRRRSC